MNIFTRFAFKSLIKNRSQTVFSLIGILIATAMNAAVIIGGSSIYRHFQILNNKEERMFRTIWMLTVLLLTIIMISSVILIYNSFSISIHERKKQYGLLASLGATKRQLRRTVMAEAVFVCIIGIPFGVLLGIGGLEAVSYVLKSQLEELLQSGDGLIFRISVVPWTVAAICVLSFVTVLTAVYMPACRVMKISAVEAIRQTEDVVYHPKKIRTRGFVRHVFGLEGELAAKNYKRSRGKYRTTVFSIFISIVLFVSASSFCSYLTDSIHAVAREFKCDIWMNARGVAAGAQTEELFAKFMKTPGVVNGEYHYLLEGCANAPADALSSDLYRKNTGHTKEQKQDGEVLCEGVGVVFVQDAVYDSFIRKQHLDQSEYIGNVVPKALVYDTVTLYDPEQRHYKVSSFFAEKPDSLQMLYAPDRYTALVGENAEVFDIQEVQLGDMVYSLPDGIEHEAYYLDVALIYPERAMGAFSLNMEQADSYMTFRSGEHEKSYDEMNRIIAGSAAYADVSGYNVAAANRENRANILIIRVFTYGFLLMMSCTAIANIMNVVSANGILRKKEIAMLRSVGMTRFGFLKISVFESFLYGSRGVLFGLPVAAALSALLWYCFADTVEFPFYIRWDSLVCAVAGVFAIIGGTMFYTLRKTWNDNIADSLRQD